MRKALSEDGFEIEVFDLDDNLIATFNTLEEADDFIYEATYS
jgi:hypothetical protein